MKKLLTILSLCFVAIAMLAQEKANILVSYDVKTPSFKKGKDGRTYQFALLVNSNESKFYCPRVEYLDSLKSTPQGRDVYQRVMNEAIASGKTQSIPSAEQSYYIIKKYNGNLSVYDVNLTDKYRYTEPSIDWNWEIVDSTKTVLQYECILATTKFHGRTWHAWFAPEIPIHSGPWKLAGLPGLILEAICEGGQYSFIATGIERTDKTINPVYLSNIYENINRKSFLKIRRSYLENPMGNLNSQYGSDNVILLDGNGNKIPSLEYLPREEVDFIETDY